MYNDQAVLDSGTLYIFYIFFTYFLLSSTFKGTQSHHQFIPNVSRASLTMKKTSFATHSKEYSLAEGGSSKVQMTIEEIKPGKFYTCQYDNGWYFCVANYVSSKSGDGNMKFLYPKGPSKIFLWPQCDNACWIPIKDVYCEVDAPSTGSSAWFYCFDKKLWNILKAISIKTSSCIAHYYLSSHFPFSICIFF